MIRSESDIQDQEIHLVVGDPPCQGISLIGKRALDDERNSLLKEFVRLVLELRPRPSYPSPRYTPRRIDGSLPEESLLPLGLCVSDALADLPDADTFEELLRGDSVASTEYSEPSPYAAILRGVTQDLRNHARPRSSVSDRLTASARTAHAQKSVDRFTATLPGTTERISRFLRLHPKESAIPCVPVPPQTVVRT
ncbi:DNA cytosine methyltransferase [Actinotignum schaalii]|uniref:Modification methylase XorII n=1 Tax=Actinotignum schaalii FB123-CNA-2 TaxID=883067 RepID=S2WEP7_9ACTO|nr:modification methylase XorII [Actinotignum schaalii FB123-CNA-2]